jgi:hypothetical protein
MSKLKIVLGLLLGSAPVLALAQTSGGVSIGGNTSSCGNLSNSSTLLTLLCRIGQIINAIVPVLIALGVLYFVWGVIQYVVSGDEEAKTAGRDKMIMGIIGLAVILGLWGLVNILRNTFGVSNVQNITLPTVPVLQE